MQLNLLAFAVPLFLSFMVIEYWLANRRGKPYFNLANSAANLHIGIAERMSEAFVTSLFYFVYDYLHREFGIFNIPSNIATWVLLLLCTDFIWYWYHRAGHKINLFWGVHIVHHQSEDFNYTVSARITILQSFVRTCFWAFLPILGFPAPMVTTVLLVHGAYSFFTHTQIVGKLGWLEKVLVTPSHHRVHHASNEKYLDKNFSDVFIIWDKIFGTFEEEREAPVYGLTHQLRSNSFLWQHFHFLAELFVAVVRAKGIANKMKLLFGPPEIIDHRIRLELEQKLNTIPQKEYPVNKLNRYVFVQTIGCLIGLFLFLLFFEQLAGYYKFFIALVLLISLVICGAVLEQRKWIFTLEITRIILAVFVILPICTVLGVAIMMGIVITTVIFFTSINRGYLNLVYKQR